jgi:hypothetical protein
MPLIDVRVRRMADSLGALGLATRGGDDRLSVWFVEVNVDEEEDVVIDVRNSWQGTRGRDDASQLIDVHDVIVNALDSPHLGEITAVAVKRAESPRGRPTKAYDRKVRFEGAAMLAAHSQGKRYFDFRTNQLGPGKELARQARSLSTCPTDTEALEALDAACAALCHLR